MKKYLHIMVFFSAILVACSSKTSTTLSSDATVKRFYFAGDVRYPGLAEATFVVDDRVDTGWIYPKDSLKFGTRLDSVVPRFTFAAIPSSSLLTIGDRTLSLTGTDTLNFNQKPIYVTITAADGKAKKVYEISVYVHQIDPDLYVWEELATEITPPQPMEGKALMAEQVFYYYTNDGFQNSLYTSANARVWTKESTPVGLPTDCRVRSICYVDTAETFYYADATGVYTSWDGINWSHDATPGYEPVTMLLSFNDEAWLLVRRTGETALHLATVDVLGEIKLRDDLLPRDTLPADFPVYGFAAVEYYDKAQRPHAFIAGGFNSRGTMVATAYNIELRAPATELTDAVYRLTDYTAMQQEREPFAYRSYIWYHNQLESYGGVDAAMQLDDAIRFSQDAGLSWETADSTVSRYPEGYRLRYQPSVTTDGEYLYIIGGQGTEGIYTDAYRARLNSIFW